MDIKVMLTGMIALIVGVIFVKLTDDMESPMMDVGGFLCVGGFMAVTLSAIYAIWTRLT